MHIVCVGDEKEFVACHQEHVKREKQIMAECDCPFMVNLVTSFKDGSHLYMLMECVMGGELFTYLQSRSGPLKEDHARFYAASVVCGLEYMQERNLMWRYSHSSSASSLRESMHGFWCSISISYDLSSASLLQMR